MALAWLLPNKNNGLPLPRRGWMGSRVGVFGMAAVGAGVAVSVGVAGNSSITAAVGVGSTTVGVSVGGMPVGVSIGVGSTTVGVAGNGSVAVAAGVSVGVGSTTVGVVGNSTVAVAAGGSVSVGSTTVGVSVEGMSVGCGSCARAVIEIGTMNTNSRNTIHKTFIVPMVFIFTYPIIYTENDFWSFS
jgi:hypothetical protein